MTTPDLEELRRLHEAATPGPWETRQAKEPTDGAYDFAVGALVDGVRGCIAEAFGRTGYDQYPPAEANAAIIAAARNALPWLLDEIARLTAAREAAEARVRERVAAYEARQTEGRAA